MKILTKIFVLISLVIMCLAYSVQAENDGYIVKFKDGFAPDTEKYSLEEIGKGKNLYSAENIGWKSELEEYIVYIEENSKAFLIEGEGGSMPFSISEIDELYYTWMEIVDASYGWIMGAFGNDVRVGVIDSGCYPHEDLMGNLLAGKNFLNNNNNTNDDIGHGTHVTGILAAEIENGGIAGVAPKAKIIPLKCFGSEASTYADTLAAAIYAAVDVYKCDIINMSWGVQKDNIVLREAIEYADSKGVIMVAAVGNSYSSTVFYPAGYDEVIGVGSVNVEKEKSDFSQYNKSVMIMAPGENMKSTYNDGDYIYMRGTSQASPVISGIAAVVLSADKRITSTRFKELLISTAQDLGTAGYDIYYGYGLVNEKAILDKILETVDYYVSPINKDGNSAYVKIRNNSTETLNAESLFARYGENKFSGVSKASLTLRPGATVTVTTGAGSGELKHFLWFREGGVFPAADKR